MAFTAEITFTGICGIVPRQEPPNPPEAFCVVLPNAWQPNPASPRRESAIDKFSPLRRHAAFVHFSTHAVRPNNPGRDLEGFWYLLGHRFEINPTFATVGAPAAWGNTAGLATYQDVTSHAALLTVANAVLTPSYPMLAAHTIIANGTLSSPAGSPTWVFDNFLRASAVPAQRKLNHCATVVLTDLTSLEISLTSFLGVPAGRSHTFSQGPVFITVANLCDTNPLQWGSIPPPSEFPDDEDFRWHYEIIDNPALMQNALQAVGNLRCPIPRLAAGRPGGNGMNCDPIRFPAVPF